MSAGDDVNGGIDRDTAEIYEPPYLFKGPRPVISSAPASVQLRHQLQRRHARHQRHQGGAGRARRHHPRQRHEPALHPARPRPALRRRRRSPRRPAPSWPRPATTCCSWSTAPACRPWRSSSASSRAPRRPAAAWRRRPAGRPPPRACRARTYASGMAVDGSLSTRWGSTATDSQWWQVDLGSVRKVERVELNWEAAYASRYKIQTSTDGTNFSDAADVTISSAGAQDHQLRRPRRPLRARPRRDPRHRSTASPSGRRRVFGPPRTPPAAAAPPPPPPPLPTWP